MKQVLIALLLAASASADVVKLVGDNSEPGLVNLQVNGSNYQALDITGQWQAYPGQAWNANVVDLTDLHSDANDLDYGPQDPKVELTDWVEVYTADTYLMQQMSNATTDQQREEIQDAAYYLSGASGYGYNSYVGDAEAAYASGQQNTSGFYAVESPINDSWRQQGFLIEGLQGSSIESNTASAWIEPVWPFGDLTDTSVESGPVGSVTIVPEPRYSGLLVGLLGVGVIGRLAHWMKRVRRL